jgi:hypothetical protein
MLGHKYDSQKLISTISVDNCVQISFFLFKINEKVRMVRNMADGFRNITKETRDENKLSGRESHS